ncbi:hypothetical protein ACOSP7_016800 [Xanthoceras sorbifolium]
MNSSPLVLTSDRLMERIDWIRNKDMGNWAEIAQLNGFYRHQIPSILQLQLMYRRCTSPSNGWEWEQQKMT